MGLLACRLCLSSSVTRIVRFRLHGSGHILERTKTCTDPPFVCTEPKEPRAFLKGSLLPDQKMVKLNRYGSTLHLNRAGFCTVCEAEAWSRVMRLC